MNDSIPIRFELLIFISRAIHFIFLSQAYKSVPSAESFTTNDKSPCLKWTKAVPGHPRQWLQNKFIDEHRFKAIFLQAVAPGEDVPRGAVSVDGFREPVEVVAVSSVDLIG